MIQRISVVVAALGIIGCAGKSAPAAVDPARGLKALATEDREVSDIAIAAARSLPMSRTSQPLFGGVYVNERKSRSATDAVKRATGFTEVAGPPRRRQLRCTARTSGGQEREIPCPAAAVSAIPPTFTFVEVRATDDSAYVGLEEADDLSEKSSCITLLRRIGGWSILSTSIVASAKQCGK